MDLSTKPPSFFFRALLRTASPRCFIAFLGFQILTYGLLLSVGIGRFFFPRRISIRIVGRLRRGSVPLSLCSRVLIYGMTFDQSRFVSSLGVFLVSCRLRAPSRTACGLFASSHRVLQVNFPAPRGLLLLSERNVTCLQVFELCRLLWFGDPEIELVLFLKDMCSDRVGCCLPPHRCIQDLNRNSLFPSSQAL